MSIAVNHLAHFSLLCELLSTVDPVHGRIVFSGSCAHWPDKASLVKGYPTHVPEDLDLLVHPKADNEGEELGRGFQRYAVSRLVPIMVMYELNRRLKIVSIPLAQVQINLSFDCHARKEKRSLSGQ